MFSDGTNQAAFLCQSFIYERARGALRFPRFLTPPPAKHQMSAHLHCLYGVPILSAHPQGRHTGTSRMSVFACSKVYDLRQYTRKTMWGPFMADGSGRVDWEKVEAVMIAIGANLKQVGLSRLPICKKVWEEPFPGVWPDSYTPAIASSSPPSSATAGASAGSEAATDDVPSSHEGSELPDLDREDPYGISGTWLRIVCFLDYTDFFAYNFVTEEPPPANIPRPAIDAGEETRLILMQLHVTRIEPPGPTDGQALPVVYYEGIAGSLDGSGDPNASSDIRGTIEVKGENGRLHAMHPLCPIALVVGSFRSFFFFFGSARFLTDRLLCIDRHRAPDARRRGTLDLVLHLQRGGEVAVRGYTGRRPEEC